MTVLSCSKDSSTGQGGSRLSKSTSPYLLGHADNPVDWYEWGDEALDKAQKENKPIIISIGYASCHWCHVMEDESFMDTAVANYMNRHFISIKVDREERPDLDNIYLNAAQLINGQGGWPLNAFALPDGKPFYAGTYFSRDQWLRLLKNIKEAYAKDFDKIKRQSEDLTSEILKIQSDPKERESSLLDDWTIANLVKDSLMARFDSELGGLRGAPKFPEPLQWEFLLQMARVSANDDSWKATQTTLNRMMNGGIYDGLQGGFFRYATDDQWRIPHFEKMLYDNALLMRLYAHGYQYSGNIAYKRILSETFEWLIKEMLDAHGGFYSSINADSEGREGQYYIWTHAQMEQILSKEEWTLVQGVFDIKKEGNWEDGKNILYKSKNILKKDAVLYAGARAKMLKARGRRIRPATDDKILTSWNALMIQGLVEAFRATGQEAYLNSALKTARFLESTMVDKDGRLHRSYRKGKVAGVAFLEDYAYLSASYLDLYQATFDRHWLEAAEALVVQTDKRFLDPKSGFYLFNAKDQKQPLVPNYAVGDQVMPSSVAVMAQVKYRLGKLMYKQAFLEHAEELLQKMKPVVSASPMFYSSWAQLSAYRGYGFYEVAVTGRESLALSRQLQRKYLPNAVFAGGDSDTIPLLKDKILQGKNMIFVCKERVCKRPTQDVKEALEQIDYKSRIR